MRATTCWIRSANRRARGASAMSFSLLHAHRSRGRRRGAARRPLRDSGPWGPCVAPCQTHQPVGTLAPARLGSVAMRSTVPREAPSECRGAGWAWPSERGTSEDWTSRDARRGLPEGDNSVAGLLLHLEGLDHVALRDVDALAEADTALEALADLGDVVLLAAQRLDGELLLDHEDRKSTRLNSSH